MVLKIYIAGKITDNPSYRAEFKKAERYLTSKGHICMNPTVLPKGFSWDDYMHICFTMIDACESIYMLKNWKNSKGAKVEYSYAKSKKKKILFQ